MPSAEILAVLADEVTEAGTAIGAALLALVRAHDAAAFEEARSAYLEPLARISATCEALELSGLQRACTFIERNIGVLEVGGVDAELRLLLDRWPTLVLGYLHAPRDGVYSREIAQSMRRQAWPDPLEQSAAEELEQDLLDVSHIADVESAPARPTEAHPEDVALAFPDDVNPKLVDAFLSEGPQQAAEYSALIQRIVHGEAWTEELGECRRLIHALKGAANTVGVRGIASLCHHVEDILEFLVDNSAVPDQDLARLLIKVADTLEQMFEALLGSAEVPPDAQAVLQSVLDVINRIDRGELSGAKIADDRTEPPVPADLFPAEPVQEKSAGSTPSKIEPKIRVEARLIDQVLWTSGEIAISGSHVQERMKHALAVVAELRERQQALWDRSSDMESFVTTQGIAAGRRHVAASAAGAPAGFDPLEMDQYSELHTYVHGITETVADLQLLGGRLIEALTTVNTAVGQQMLLNNEVHDLLMTSRMVSVRNFESRLQRALRQAAEQCGKNVQLRVDGADVMFDDQLASQLIDPLQHLLRNAVDHGIEESSMRAAFGKPDTGQIELRFARSGNYLLVSCSDDGAGLDLARIRAHAVASGLIAEDSQLSEEEIARLILRSGFSTADTVTEVSGRGVGMDIVNAAVAKLKGTIDIRTQTGHGTTFLLRVPISLGVVHSLLVTAGRETFALPTDNLERIVYEGAQHLRSTTEGLRFTEGDVDIRAYSLARLVGNAPADGDANGRHVVIMKQLTDSIALAVDVVSGGNDLVVKGLGRYLSGLKGVIGASILGDGAVVPILDLPELIGRGDAAPASLADVSGVRSTEADVLIVDDSLSVRTALAALLGDAGFRVRLAKDGVEAIESINDQLPAVVVADLEMPRMNGLELTSHIRNSPAIRHVPVIMLTSRSADKHRKQAIAAGVDDYVTKPYRDSDLILRVRALLGRKAA